MPSPMFLIFERNRVIGQDLAEIVMDWNPSSTVTVVSDRSAAEAWLATSDMLTAAFMPQPKGDTTFGGIVKMIESRGGKIVVMHDDENDEVAVPDSWHTLQRPFTTNSVLRILRGFDAENGGTADPVSS